MRIPTILPLCWLVALPVVPGCSESPPAESPAEPESPVPTEPAATTVEKAESKRTWRGHTLSPGAKPELHRTFLEDRERTPHPSDGGGVVRLQNTEPVAAGGRGQWTFQFQAGPKGIAVGGSLYFQVSPFWGWSNPQTEDPRFAGYTTVACSNREVTLQTQSTMGQHLLILEIAGAPLAAGDTIDIVYGAGEALAATDQYAEGKEFFYFAVDGDGDGYRELLSADVEVNVPPGSAADFLVTLPSRTPLNAEFDLVIAFVDRAKNRAPDFTGTIALTAPEELGLPAEIEFKPGDRGSRRIRGEAGATGIFQVEVLAEGATRLSNPMLVEDSPLRLYWADFHGHSTYSDGTATPTQYYEYARDVTALDVACLTDHDHYGMRKLSEQPKLWEHIKEVTNTFHQPDKFVTLQGYEWTSWLFGHRHVVYFHNDGKILDCLDENTDTPDGLWQALEGQDVITVAHHTGGGPVPVDWSFAPPPELEPVVEIVSVHGNSESARSPLCIRNPAPGSFVRDALSRGYRLGIIGSGDSHDGHPGLASRPGPSSGLAGIYAESLTRKDILKALRRRSVFATSGPRISLQFRIGSTPMGRTHELDGEQNPPVIFRVVGTTDLKSIDLIKNSELYFRFEIEDASVMSHSFRDLEFAPGDWMYLRVIQKDSSMAWSSPIWMEE